MRKNKLIYFFYYLKQLDWNKFSRFTKYVVQNKRISKLKQLRDILVFSFRYNISILDYYYFHFYQLPASERATYAGSGFMYEYQLVMNPNTSRSVLHNKLKFLETFAPFIHRNYIAYENIVTTPEVAERILTNPSGKFVMKSSDGQCGAGVEVRDTREFNITTLVEKLKATGNNLVEEYVTQHHELMRLSPSGLNTVRIITQLDPENQVHILGARLRISVNSVVDNMAAGNIAAPINLETGVVDGPGVYSDITKHEESVHPVTGVEIEGFQIPFWKDAVELAKNAALVDTGNRSVGWDIAITENGPELIEGNHNWCKLLWQLPVKKGLKSELLKYL